MNETKESDGPGDASTGIFSLTVQRPVAILMVVVAIVVFGLVSYNRLSLNLMPDITYPSLTIRTEFPGAAPEEVENQISRPVEEAVGVVNNLVSINSISKSEISDVILEFTWDTDMNIATQDVREKLDPIYYPDGAEKPIILRYDPSLDPVMRLGVYGVDDLYYLRKICDEDIKRELEGIQGVAAVKIKGGLEEEIHIEINERQLASLGLDIGLVNQRLAQENINLAGGKLKEGDAEYLVRTFNEFRDLDEIGDVVVGELNGVSLRVKDMARVSRSHSEREVITRVNGQESVEIEIYKEADANAVEVASLVKETLFGTEEQRAYVEHPPSEEKEQEEHLDDKAGKTNAGEKGHSAEDIKRVKQEKAYASAMKREMTNFLSHKLPSGVQISTLSDQSIFIENSVREVRNTALFGGILAIIVLFLFLRQLTSTLIVGLSIPISIIATFACMHVGNVSLNIMSLGGLALGVGMLVDNSIVVIESIFRCREEGDGVIQSSLRGVSEVSGAVIASTLTTIAVFFPIVFVEGVAGQVFGDMSLTVVFALLTSLAVSLFVIPVLASQKISKAGEGEWRKSLEDSSFLRFEALSTRPPLKPVGGDDNREEAPGPPVWTHALHASLRQVPTFLSEVCTRIGLLLGTMIEVLLKAVVSILFPLIGALIALLRLRWRGVRADGISAWLGRDRGLLLSGGGEAMEVWGGIFLYTPVEDLLQGLRRLWGWATSRGKGHASSAVGNVLMRAALIVPTISGMAYILLKYLFHTVISLVGKTGILVIHLVIVAATVLFVLTGALVAPILVFLGAMFDRGYQRLSEAYPKVLKRAVENPGIVITTAGAIFLISLLLLLPRIGRELIPEVHQGEFNVEVRMPVGTPLRKTLDRIGPIEKIIQAREDVEEVATVVGVEKKSNPSAEEGEYSSKLTVELTRGGDMAEKEEGLIEYLRRRLAMIPDADIRISRPSIFSFKTPVEVEIEGYDLASLARISREIMFRMSKIPGLSDVKTNIQKGYPEVQIRYDRNQLARYGLSVYDVAALVRKKVQGDIATEFREADRKIDIRVRLRETDKESVDDLRRLTVNPGGEIPIPLSAVASIEIEEGTSEIRRIDQHGAARISANPAGI